MVSNGSDYNRTINRLERVGVANLHLQSVLTLFMAENPLSHSAVDAGSVRIRSTRDRRDFLESQYDLLMDLHVSFSSFLSQSGLL